MLNALIVDDEPSARDNLRHLLEAEAGIAIIGECANAIEAISQIHRLQPDVVFLDIQMPRISGLEMVGMLDPNRMPHIVFLTAYDEYAVQAFEEHAFDYLLKPAEPKRLSKTLQRLRQRSAPQDVAALEESAGYLKYIPCTGHSRIYLLRFDEVLAIRSKLSGVFVVQRRHGVFHRADAAHAGKPYAAGALPSAVSGQSGAGARDPLRRGRRGGDDHVGRRSGAGQPALFESAEGAVGAAGVTMPAATDGEYARWPIR